MQNGKDRGVSRGERLARWHRRAKWPALALAGGLSVAAHAGLGESVDSVARDHAALRGIGLTSRAMPTFDVHEITTQHGTLVRHYVSRSGSVFATSWSGPSLPDLKVVLGRSYAEYTAAAQSSSGQQKILSISTQNLVLRVVRYPRGLAGWAHVPGLLPPGAVVDEDSAGSTR
jgi:hypothetical protein